MLGYPNAIFICSSHTVIIFLRIYFPICGLRAFLSTRSTFLLNKLLRYSYSSRNLKNPIGFSNSTSMSMSLSYLLLPPRELKIPISLMLYCFLSYPLCFLIISFISSKVFIFCHLSYYSRF